MKKVVAIFLPFILLSSACDNKIDCCTCPENVAERTEPFEICEDDKFMVDPRYGFVYGKEYKWEVLADFYDVSKWNQVCRKLKKDGCSCETRD